ncbi:hypothetical protein Tco_0306851 [Tanacetum coccineum]
MMESRFSQGKGLVIKEILEDNVVEKFTGEEEGKLLLLGWNDSNQVGNMGTSKPNAISSTKMLLDIHCELGHTGDRLMDKCSQANYMQDGIQNASIIGGVEADKYTFMELDQDLF